MKQILKKAANGLVGSFGLQIQKKESSVAQFATRIGDSEFLESYSRNSNFTMVPWTGCFTAFSAGRYVGQNNIEGALVECGVYRGGCSMLMADGLRSVGVTDKTIYMYDTYAGMTEPTELDKKASARGTISAVKEYGETLTDDHSEWSYCPIEQVEENLKTSLYPYDQFKPIKGKVEDTIPDIAPEKISVLRLDTDWYESTKHEMHHLFPRLVKGGILIIDDYGSWEGSKIAVDEYFSEQKYKPHFFRDITNGAVSCIKLD